MSGFNYSKWDNIELSDDESDLHPNIDKDSWFRMKHRARLEREEKEDHEVAEMQRATGDDNARLSIINARLRALKSAEDAGERDEDGEFEDMEALQGEADELQRKISKRDLRISEIREKRAWNIDNICKVTEEKTIVNKLASNSLRADDFVPTGETEKAMETSKRERTKESSGDAAAQPSLSKPSPSETSAGKPEPKPSSISSSSLIGPSLGPVGANSHMSSEKLSVISYNDFVLAHEQLLETYSDVETMEATKEMLFRNCDILLHEHSQSYMLLSCLEDEMNGKRRRMRHVCRQSQILSHINELGISMKRDPRDVILPFFKRLDEREHLEGFTSAVEDFTQRIIKRAVEKRKEMDAEREEEEERVLGPGGLDPLEVLKLIPASLREAFESRDMEKLNNVLATMRPSEAKKWMKMCVDSGLWVPQNESIFENLGDGDEDDEDDTDGEDVGRNADTAAAKVDEMA